MTLNDYIKQVFKNFRDSFRWSIKKRKLYKKKNEEENEKKMYKYISKPYFYYTVFEIYLTVITNELEKKIKK